MLMSRRQGKPTKTLMAYGAYGRTYATDAEALSDWTDGKDFKVYGGPYFSIRDRDALCGQEYTQVKVYVNGTGEFFTISLSN